MSEKKLINFGCDSKIYIFTYCVGFYQRKISYFLSNDFNLIQWWCKSKLQKHSKVTHLHQSPQGHQIDFKFGASLMPFANHSTPNFVVQLCINSKYISY